MTPKPRMNGPAAPESTAELAAERPSATNRLLEFLPLLVVALTATLALRRLDNTDTWWHLASGRWIVTHGSIPSHDTLSWTVPGKPWVNVQWLFDVLIYGLYRLGAPSLLVIVSAAAYSAAVALLLVNLRRHVGPILTTALGTAAVVMSQDRFAIRPEMISYVLIGLILWIYGTGRTPGRSRRLWLLPAVMCVFANSHSLFIVGGVVIACYMAGSLLSEAGFLPAGWRQRLDPAVRRRVLASGAAAIAATVVNPFLLTGAFFPITLMTRINGAYPFFRAIGEFKRPFEGYFVTASVKVYRFYFVFAMLALLASLVVTAARATPSTVGTGSRRSERRRRDRSRGIHARAAAAPPAAPAPEPERHGPVRSIDLADVAVLVGVGYLSLLARRNMALFAIAGGPALASCLAAIGSRFRPAARLGSLRTATAGLLALVLVAGCGYVASNRFYGTNDVLHEFGLGTIGLYFPTRAADFVREHRLPGPMFNDFTSGGYLSWDRPTGSGVYVDGRTEVYDVDFLGPYTRQVQRPPEWQAEMDRRGVQTAVLFHWWTNHHALVRYLATDPRWALVYYDETCVIAVRQTAENAGVIEQARIDFPAKKSVTEQLLLDESASWQWPVARVRGLKVYANLLTMIGRSADARPFAARYARLVRGTAG